MTGISLSCWSESDQKAIREQLVLIGTAARSTSHSAGSDSWSTSSMKLLPGAVSG